MLDELYATDDFVRRHIGPRGQDIQEMFKTIGVSGLDQLIDETIPPAIRLKKDLDLPAPRSERDALSDLRRLMNRNRVFVSMIGAGYYGTVTPGVIIRRILENPGWYTAYTPYQAEISQGRLEALLNFQQMVIDLSGMEIANASLLDEATAAAEAMTMAKKVSKNKSNTFCVDSRCHPQTIEVIKTRAGSMGIEVDIRNFADELPGQDCFAALAQYPDTYGFIEDLEHLANHLHTQKSLLVVAADLLALCLLKPPGEMGADIVIGSSQRFGVPMGYGGPHAAYFATKDSYKRSMPGRIIGVSKDARGEVALRMALQTREQHIRRDKATSNICTAQVLLAIIASMYAVYHGPKGLKRIATRVHELASMLGNGLKNLGFKLKHEHYFDTITVMVPGQAERIVAKARESNINLRLIDESHVGIACDETTRLSDIQSLWTVFSTRATVKLDFAGLASESHEAAPASLVRQSSYLDHPVFHQHHSETELLRYQRELQAKDIALDRSMIPLGSCTMKLNSTTEMEAITWRPVAHLHPYCPLDQAQGYLHLFEDLEDWLAEITGFDAVSLQPNAGSQGEYTGLLTISHYLKSKGEGHRNICLIPSSAHGTNPASAVMAGMDVVVVECDDQGNISVEDLKVKIAKHKDQIAAIMVTYPSTHGVFEEAIIEICDLVHEAGGQVYLDGANLNAQVGLCRPGDFGADVSHINLHKTFCIPHGGGGPGMGPIGVKAHLAPFLPDHPMVQGVNPAAGTGTTVGPVSAAPWGSSAILPIPWAYIAMMGPKGLAQATRIAILNANYMAARLEDHFPILYKGKNGRVAHECIIDVRGLKEKSGITAEDIAKRLMDFGFHAPTVSFPVAETLMIEPTESENKAEIDRFCDAMIQISKEIHDIMEGRSDKLNNPLKNAPHHHDLLLEEWDLPYSRDQAFFPGGRGSGNEKYWPPVSRVDNVYGDRNLICTCPSIDEYRQAAE